jgi:hypothetical protein
MLSFEQFSAFDVGTCTVDCNFILCLCLGIRTETGTESHKRQDSLKRALKNCVLF